MDARDRLARLRALASELERLSASPTRDALLMEVRGRAVALETGAQTSSAWDGTHPGEHVEPLAAIAAELRAATE